MIHLYRTVIPNGRPVFIEVFDRILVGEAYAPPKGSDRVAWAIASCHEMEAFYGRHGISVEHWLGIQRGWTVEYLRVPSKASKAEKQNEDM